jgi:hypothetical protein
MDFAQTNGLSMIGNDDFVTEEQLNGFVTLDTSQNITGNKTLSGTTTITGDITANAVNITPAELGFIGGLTSDAQTQLNGKVGITNDETISGNKTFSGTTTFTGDISANAVNITPQELGFIGGLTSDAQTQITARALDTKVVHRADNLDENVTGIKTFTSKIVGTANIDISGAAANAIVSTSVGNQINALGGGSNLIYASIGNNTIQSLSGSNSIIATSGSNILQVGILPKLTITSLSNTHINDAHYLRNDDSTRTYASFDGLNNIITNVDNTLTASTGKNVLNSTSGSNEIRVGGTPKITTLSTQTLITNATNTLNTTIGGLNEILVNNLAKITTSTTTNTLSNDNNIYNSATSGKHEFQINAVARVTINNTDNVFTNTTNTINGVTNINGVTTFNVPPVSATAPSSNSEIANKKYVDDTIVAGAFVTLAGSQTISGAKIFTAGNLFAAQNATNQLVRLGNVTNFSFIDFRSGGTHGDYDVRMASNGGSGTIGRGSFAVEAGNNTLYALTSGSGGRNVLHALGGSGSYNQMAGYLNYMDGVDNNYIRINDVIKIQTTSSINTFTNTGSNVMTATGGSGFNRFDATTQNLFQIGGANKLTIQSNLLNSASPIYVATRPLLSGFITLTQSDNTISVAGVAMNIGGFARKTNPVQQGILPHNATFYAISFLSDNADQTSASTITLEFNGNNIGSITANATGSGTYQSTMTYITEFSLGENTGFYSNIKTSAVRAANKAWVAMLYYFQY